MRFEGILKEYLEAVATGFNRSGCRRFIHPKRGGNRNRGPVQIGPVGSDFRSFSGPRNWTFKHYKRVKGMVNQKVNNRHEGVKNT